MQTQRDLESSKAEVKKLTEEVRVVEARECRFSPSNRKQLDKELEDIQLKIRIIQKSIKEANSTSQYM